MRNRSGDQEGSNHKLVSGGASVGDSIGVLYTVHSSSYSPQTHDDQLHWLETSKQLALILIKASIFVCFITFNLLHPLTH